MMWEYDIKFIEKRIQEQKVYIQSFLMADRSTKERQELVLNSANGQLEYFQNKKKYLHGIYDSISHINASKEFLSKPENLQAILKMVEAARKM